jgi:hypothetical protein
MSGLEDAHGESLAFWLANNGQVVKSEANKNNDTRINRISYGSFVRKRKKTDELHYGGWHCAQRTREERRALARDCII